MFVTQIPLRTHCGGNVNKIKDDMKFNNNGLKKSQGSGQTNCLVTKHFAFDQGLGRQNRK